MHDRIEKQVELNVPVSRVWQALTDEQEFGQWFHVHLEAPFKVGQLARGRITYPGYEYLKWEAMIEAMQPENRFAFRWHPAAVDPRRDYSQEPGTLVEFHLYEVPDGTLLTLTESGFDQLPEDRREDAYAMNEGGWTEQMKNIQHYLLQTV